MIRILLNTMLALFFGAIPAAAYCKVALALALDVSSSFKGFEYRPLCDALLTLGVTPSSATNDREKVIHGSNALLARTPRFADDLCVTLGKFAREIDGDLILGQRTE